MNGGIAAALGLVFGLAIAGIVLAATGRLGPADSGATGAPEAAGPVEGRRRFPFGRTALSGAAVAAVWAATGWPVAAIGAGLLIWFAPKLFGGEAAFRTELARIDAVASWTESLRDNLAAAAGLEQTITASARYAPPALQTEVEDLAADLHAGVGLEHALRTFAAKVDDETCDLAVMALGEAAVRAGNLAAVLDDLAAAAREEAAMRMRIHTSRARVRTAARVITAVTVAMAAGLIALGGDYLDPYNSAVGQVVLAIAFGCTALGLVWLHRLAAAEPPASFLRDDFAQEGISS